MPAAVSAYTGDLEPNNGLADSAECGQSRCNLKTWHNKSWIGYTKSNSTHNPKEQCNTRSIEVAQLDHEIHTALALPELDADAIIDKILRRAELQFNYCAAGDDDPTTMQIKRACKEFKPTDTFPESFYSSIVSKIILHLDTHIDIKLRNGQTL